MTSARAALAGASIGLLGAAAESLRPSLTPRSTLHQGLVTGVMATTGTVAGAGVGWLVGRVVPRQSDSFVPAAVAVAAAAAGSVAHGWQLSTRQDQAHEEWGPHEGHRVLGAGAGALTAAGIAATGAVAGRELGNAGRSLATRLPGSPPLWSGALMGVGATAVTGAGSLALRRVLRGLAKDGRAADAALAEPTKDPFVSGGPGSAVDYDTLSREGRRFVAWRVSRDDLERAGIDGQEPVRVYVGIDTASGISARVDLALAELERLGAFDKAAIIAVSPAGSGYANSVPVEALEYLTAGNCAAVSVQYGVLPSMFSRDRLPLAAQTFRLLIDRIAERTQQQPEGARPRLYLYGESLGAQAAELALRQEPSLVDPVTASVERVSAALFVGTPGGPSLRDDLLHHPHTVHADQWQALPDPLPTGVQLWFLEHDADPVTRFRRDLAVRRPAWLTADPRGRNVPDAMRWVPVGTWQQVLLDVAYATQAQSGVFRSVGHDYRADLAPLVAAAFAPERRDQVPAVQAALADREVTRDRRLAAAEGEAVQPADPGAADVVPGT